MRRIFWSGRQRLSESHCDAPRRRRACRRRCGQESRTQLPGIRRKTDHCRADELAERETDQDTHLGAGTPMYPWAVKAWSLAVHVAMKIQNGILRTHGHVPDV